MTELGDWHVDALTLENFRCFEQITLTLHPSLTVLVGVNGTGKTAILDAIAIMLSTALREFEGPTRGFTLQDAHEVPHDMTSQDAVARMERSFPVSAHVSGTLAGTSYSWNRVRQSAQGRTSWSDKSNPVGKDMAGLWRASGLPSPEAPLLPVIALYGVERLLGVRRASGSIARSRSGAYDSALDGKSDISRLSTYIKALTFAEFVADRRGEDAEAAGNQLRAITLACNTILDGSGWQNPEWSPIPEELTLAHAVHGTLPLSFLSSGIKIAAGLVIDLVSRIARANPSLGASELLARAPGIVLIDEVDLHLHPSWQQQILPQLTKAFPRVQFIVTTHSPQVLSTVEAENIRVIDGSEVREVKYSAGLRSDIIMDSILGTSPEPSLEINHVLQQYMSLVDQGSGRSDEAKKLRQRIDEQMGGIMYVPRLADADASIAFYDLDS
ncbi:hypothetical protein E3T55_01105 [Cryobacterium frigoriphilum]|uniref:AAA+ ATPase domain-containing protein n=1 Tax=Cryobacterium frigoriphilum TaxID=1259150 RepID=A0A4R9ABB5_9MICO|nr:AAA family ATPase [Cryobacterium frigoriphilum]TFD55435.1 hypothetical protein E3T55_01105 [Cryobacterium frigoriphilum]